jgi:CheY-like chemotaxis protein
MAHTILVADDSKTIRKIVEMALKASPFQLIEAASARATMEAVQRGPDVILLDYYMPDGSGYDVCRAIKQNAATRHIPVVMMGGTYRNFDENMARQAGANAVITKPFKVDDLLGALKTAMSGATQAPAPRAATPSSPAPPPNPFSANPAARGNLSSPGGLSSPPPRPNESGVPGLPGQGSQPRIPTPVPQRNIQAPQAGSQPRIDPARHSAPTSGSGGSGVDRGELEEMIRSEVQRAVREELPGLLRNVMGDLFQQKILPRLVKHSEERVNAMLNENLAKRVQEQVRVELEHLLREE